LPAVRKYVSQFIWKGEGRPPDVTKQMSAAAMLEAWARVRKPAPQSLEFRKACAAYWAACGGKPLSDVGHWRWPIQQALKMDRGFFAAIITAIVNKTP
jgi:hypothetical protein